MKTGKLIATHMHESLSGVLPAIPGAPRRVRRPRARIEDGIQKAIVEYARLVLPISRYRVFHIANGAGKLSRRAGKRLKDLGLLAGVPDIEIVGPGGQSWFLEVKTDDGRPSDPQIEFQKFCTVNRIPHAIVRSLDDARRTLEGWNLVRRAA